LPRSIFKVTNSVLTAKEWTKAPENVGKLLQMIEIDFERLLVTQESLELASKYLNIKVVGLTSLDDCIHIATL
jgi:hypothetical protein